MRMSFVFGAVIFAAVVAVTLTARAEPVVSAQQLADHGPWRLDATMSDGTTYWGDITFKTAGDEVTGIAIAWDDGTKDDATLILFDGEDLQFEHVHKQSCGDRILTYRLETGEDSEGNVIFSGETRGPSSRCRSGQFKDKNVMTPKIPLTQ